MLATLGSIETVERACTRAFREFVLIEGSLGMLEEADSALFSAYRVLSEASSMLWGSIEGVISRDSVRMVPGEVDFGVGSCLGVLGGFFFLLI